MTKFGGLMSCGSKDIFTNATSSCMNIHHDVIDYVNHGAVENTKT